MPTTEPVRNATSIAGMTRHAQVQAHRAGQLHVAHPHPARVREHGGEQEQERARARDQVLEQVDAVRDQRADHPPRRQRVDDLVGKQLVVEVDAGERDQGGGERQLEDEVVVEAAHERRPRRTPAP